MPASSKKLSQSKLTKYSLYTIIWVLLLLLIGQIIVQFFTVRQLNKVTGVVASITTVLTGYESNGQMKRGIPKYDFAITLENGQTYHVDESDSQYDIGSILKKGDHIAIYSPTLFYNIISLDIIDFDRQASQVELNNYVIYSFVHHRQKEWWSLVFIVAALIPFCYMVYYNWKIERLNT